MAQEEVWRAKEAGVVAFKLYPAGATTNSDSGVTDVAKCLPTLRAMAEARAGGVASPCMRGGIWRCRASWHGTPSPRARCLRMHCVRTRASFR